jgi:hypothetical protein
VNGARDIGVSSHFPVLAAAVYKTSGPVLELGSGWGSTPMLKLMCRWMGGGMPPGPTEHGFPIGWRPFESYDNNEAWAKSMGSTYVPDWGKWEPREAHYGVAFVDCSPGEERRRIIMKLKGRAKFIVAHDHEAGPAAAYYYEYIIPQFKYVETYRVLRPHTLILSDEEPFGLSAWDQEKDP